MKNILFLLVLSLLPVNAVVAEDGRAVVRIPSSTSTHSRIALVIGNGDYSVAPLRNPKHDAQDMAASLKKLGFRVDLKRNLGRRQMISAINDFAQALKKAEIGFFFYAGHGMQSGGRNYLVPVDAALASESDLEFEAVDAARLVGKMREAGNPLNVVVLDACRNNPFKRSFHSRANGLASMNAPVGTIIAYATALGETASDGSGRNGLYTGCLLKILEQDVVNIRSLFNDAGLLVVKKTGARQVPWVSSSPVPDFYLRNNTVSTLAAGQNSPPALPPKEQEQAAVATAATADWREPLTGMEFIKIPAGCFQRGSPGSETSSRDDERPRRKICLSSFYMGRYEVTQEEYRRITGSSPAKFADGSRWPVEQVSFADVQNFLRLLKKKSKTSRMFRLPTEAEWEYAARAGSSTAYSFGQKIDSSQANFRFLGKSTGQKRTTEVGRYPANAFGLYDMHGNIWEWCSDLFATGYYRKSPQKNPLGPKEGKGHVARGGSWNSKAQDLRAARRFWFASETKSATLGFRVVFSRR